MSTGSDALSDQAESMQNAIAFFKVNGAQEQNRRQIAKPHKRPDVQMKGNTRTPAARPKAGNMGGVDIEIGSGNGTDSQDKDFTTYQ